MDKSTRQELYFIIDRLPDEEIPTARKFLDMVLMYAETHSARNRQEYLLALENAPEDDENETEEEHKSRLVAEEDIKAGRLFPWDQVKRELAS